MRAAPAVIVLARAGGGKHGGVGPIRRYSLARKSKTWGILNFTLYPDRYESVCVTVDGIASTSKQTYVSSGPGTEPGGPGHGGK
jgi:hypothetical protein